ncbi:nuclear factor 7, brain-like [Latimeria chalumnae]|uniref:nuclear factor 7, brain-like n=1 Tax=Latimeria chalumnae TaxID=7897 RepID=UPI0003C1160A|nr:PREDICTED: nuclear factor 7, brain-like [Latimeria chalumnae]|eukprot:XP_006011867.1 PREDICTED: nuclear factor 7, brain-like [Latimeria chalumnae]
MAVKAEILSSELSCSICLELFKDPVLLACGHHFCTACISQVWDGAAGTLSCPQCPQVFSQRSMNSSEPMANIMEGFQGMELKEDAAYNQSLKKETIPWRDLYCIEHKQKLNVFCEEDEKVICVICGMSYNHRTHNLITIASAAGTGKKMLEDSLRTLQNQLREAYQHLDEEVKEIRALQTKAEHLRNHIGSEFYKLRQFLDEEEKSLKAKLEGAEKKNLLRLEESRIATAQEVSKLQHTIREIEKRLQSNNVEMLMGVKAALARAQIKFLKPQRPSVDLCEGEFVGSLQYRVWTRMKLIISPDQIPEAANITTLIQKEAQDIPVLESVTIDLKTAHKQLIVSKDRSSMRYTIEQQYLPDNPERFTNYTAALGAEGFTSGRHYWEVEVGDELGWVLGVARGSVHRKDQISYSPACGLWVFGRYLFGFTVCASSGPISLPLTATPRKIRVYLDYEGGQVSFYNAGDSSLIYTYTDTFTERLYPYFCSYSPTLIMKIKNH